MLDMGNRRRLRPTMHHNTGRWILSSSVVDLWWIFLLHLFLRASPVMMTSSSSSSSSSSTVTLWRHGDGGSVTKFTSSGCYRSEWQDGLTLRCSGMGLTQVPPGLPGRTIRLYLDNNRLRSLPPDSFTGLSLLAELDLSRNKLSVLGPGCFRGLASSLRFLDLSSNQLSSLDPAVLGGLRAHANLSHNPWHCDCQLQLSMPQLDLDPSSLAEVVCHSSDLPELGAVGVPFVLLAQEWDLCLSLRRTTDVAMLVTMFLWFSMVISYLVYYIRHNQEDARRHLEYLKTLPSRHVV